MRITHDFVSAIPDDADSSFVRPSNWNSDHVVDVSAASRLLGRGDSGAGEAQEITLGAGLAMTGTALSATASGVTDGDKGDITVSSSGAVWSIDAGVVTLAKQADMATASVVYRKTAGSGAPEVQTLATLKTDLGLTGTNSGDQTSVSGNAGSATVLQTSRNFSISGGGITAATVGFDGSAAVVLNASVDAGHITLARMADVATGTIFYRKTAGTGAPEVQTLATLKTDLGLTGTNSGDQTITLTGDVTGSGTGSFAATVGNGVVTLAKMANIATASFIGRVTAGTGVPEALTGTQATTLLDAFTSGLKGLAPASGGGTSNFLRADGTWAAPPGGGGGLSDGDYGDITVSGTGTVMTIDAGVVTYAKMQDVSATDKLLGRSTAGAGDVEEIACTAAGRALLDDASAAAQATTLGLGTGDSPQFTAINIGHASDTTLARSSAGDLSVEGNAIYRAGGTDVPVADGGTGASTAAAARVNILPSMTGNSLKVLRVNVGENDFELATAGGGSGDFSGPGSSTDNAIVRFDGTGGKTGQNSAATVSDDGIIRSATNSGANAVAVPLVNWVMLTADYTLTSTTSAQKAFNTTTNGTLTLPTGVYYFQWFYMITTMSATSGNGTLHPLGGGTATVDRWGQASVGLDAASHLTTSTLTGSAAVTASVPFATAATGANVRSLVTGFFRVSTGGTLIPSVALTTAAAAVAKAGSWLRIEKIGESSETSMGAWT